MRGRSARSRPRANALTPYLAHNRRIVPCTPASGRGFGRGRPRRRDSALHVQRNSISGNRDPRPSVAENSDLGLRRPKPRCRHPARPKPGDGLPKVEFRCTQRGLERRGRALARRTRRREGRPIGHYAPNRESARMFHVKHPRETLTFPPHVPLRRVNVTQRDMGHGEKRGKDSTP